MNRNQHRSFGTALALAFLLVWAGTVAVHACSIPVFRYALDRWPADRFQLEVSPADAQKEDVASFLRNFTDSMPLNLTVVRSKDAANSHLSYPHAEAAAAMPWSGSLDAAALAQITDSPARAEIARRILAGETTVWVLVESGKKEDDDRAAASLEKRLRYLEQASQIPPIDPNDPSSKLGPGPALGVRFSLVRIHHDDPAEEVFLKMLAGPKASEAPSTGAWIAAVFGRGRALGAWPSDGFGDEQIDEVCFFLLGACSCEVKRLNPGWDLLISTDWDEQLRLAEETRLATPVPEGQTPPKPATPVLPETVTFHPATLATAPTDETGKSRTPIFIIGAALGLVALAAFLSKSRAPR